MGDALFYGTCVIDSTEVLLVEKTTKLEVAGESITITVKSPFKSPQVTLKTASGEVLTLEDGGTGTLGALPVSFLGLAQRMGSRLSRPSLEPWAKRVLPRHR